MVPTNRLTHTAILGGTTPEQKRRIVSWLLGRVDHNSADAQRNWRHLQAAHIAGQTLLAVHCVVHLHMLGQSWRDRDVREGLGQVLRLALVPLGHMTGRLPMGNSGRSDVGAFKPMLVAPGIAELVSLAKSHTMTP